jgi:hypothetical protein
VLGAFDECLSDQIAATPENTGGYHVGGYRAHG